MHEHHVDVGANDPETKSSNGEALGSFSEPNVISKLYRKRSGFVLHVSRFGEKYLLK